MSFFFLWEPLLSWGCSAQSWQCYVTGMQQLHLCSGSYFPKADAVLASWHDLRPASSYNLVGWSLDYVWPWPLSQALILTLSCHSTSCDLTGEVTAFTCLFITQCSWLTFPCRAANPCCSLTLASISLNWGKSALLNCCVLAFCPAPFSQDAELHHLMVSAAKVAPNLWFQTFSSRF